MSSAAAEQVLGRAVSVSLFNSTPPASNSARSAREVLDDAVVDHRDPALCGREVGVGVAVGRAAVGGLAGVPDAGGPRSMPAAPLDALAANAFSRLASFPARLQVTRSPSSPMTATPAES